MFESAHGIDLNMQACMRNFYNVERQAEKDFGNRIIDGRSLVRSLNISMNSILKVPEGVFKNIIVLNVSMNRLKSLNGLEECSRLQFLNASQNQIATDFTIGPLQKLKELYLSQNLLSTIKEIANLRQLRTLDLSYNKFKELDKLVEPISRMHQLKILDLQGNLVAKSQDFHERAFKLFPQIVELNPA